MSGEPRWYHHVIGWTSFTLTLAGFIVVATIGIARRKLKERTWLPGSKN